MVLTTPQARRRKANLKAVALEKKSEARSKLLSAQLDEWFNKFDTDGDKHFDRDELAALLTHLNPGAPPSSDVIDMVMKDATGVYTVSLDGKPAGRKSHMYDNSGQRSVMQGRANGTIHRDKLVPVVKKYSAYIREQAKIDAVFDKFDTDKSGTLEQSELLPLMKCVCPDVEPDEADVKFMLAEVDMDSNEQIDRNELLPLLAVWKELAQQKEAVAPFPPGSDSPRGERDAPSPLIGGVSLMRPGRSSARIGAPAASEPTAAKSATCVLL